MQLSIIIVNYNVKYFLEQALISVEKATKDLSHEVIVVDNNSVDQSVEMLQSKFPDVRLIINKNNTGFSKANNQALKEANGQYVLLLNPDTVVEEDTFKKCISFMDDHPDAGALGVKMIDGAGNFLPESKRGFPSPFVAFSKAFGLSTLFPKSKTFNKYHLGYLDNNAIHEVDVLAGAYMFIRKSVLDKVGLLDEAFFMYGEDIDLSFRIKQAGHKNYYFPETSIIHYKGESTKKGSLNYVRIFYKAMIIFSNKHFTGGKATLFNAIIQLAVYFRAFLSLIKSLFGRLLYPLVDLALLFGGLLWLKNVWANYYYNDPSYYDPAFVSMNIPLYTLIWVFVLFLSGAYDGPRQWKQIIIGILAGTVSIAAVYGFLPEALRTSRAIIVLGSMWGLFSLIFYRVLIHLFKFRNLDIWQEPVKLVAVVGSESEYEKVNKLLSVQTESAQELLGRVQPSEAHKGDALSSLDKLDEIVQVYAINELIFCAKDIPSREIIHWMGMLGPDVKYSILPENADSIIGSNSKNDPGELYTVEVKYNVSTVTNRRNKRLLDIVLTLGFLILSPILILFQKRPLSFLTNLGSVLFGFKTWVAYAEGVGHSEKNLPQLRRAVINPISHIKKPVSSQETIDRVNFLYAKNYNIHKDLDLILKSIRQLGN